MLLGCTDDFFHFYVALFAGVQLKDVSVYTVRDVAPRKPMMCLTFRAPDASSDTNVKATPNDTAEQNNELAGGPAAKKQKLSS